MWNKFKKIVLFKFMLLTVLFLQACSNIEKKEGVKEYSINSISRFSEIVEESIDSTSKALIVFDIDDTLLESNNFVGGDTWFNWQTDKNINHANGRKIIISDKDRYTCSSLKIYGILGLLFELGPYHFVESDTKEVVDAMQQKYDSIVLTSRSPDYRAGTERELEKLGIDFREEHLLKPTYAIHYDFDDGRDNRPVSYQNGIIMSTGLNKGLVLKDLIFNKIDQKYTHIFFIDDGKRNIDNMRNAWEMENAEMHVFHYTAVEKVISDDDINQSNLSRDLLIEFLKVSFPERYKQYYDCK